MKKFKVFLLSVASSFGALAADVNISSGELEDKIPGITDESVTLIGTMDARDLAALEFLSPDVKQLDMSGVTIKALSMPSRKYFGKTLFNEGEIPPYTFFKSGISTLILPSGVSSIGEGAFAGSDIEEISIPEGIEALSDFAFYGCSNLKRVTLPASLKTIGKGAFGKCTSLEAVDLSSTAITRLPERAFAGAVELKSVVLPATVASIGREAFSHTAVKSLSLENVTEFEAYALSSMPMLEELFINPDASVNEGLLMDDTSLFSLSGVPDMLPSYFAANCGNLDASLIGEISSLADYSLANTLAPETLILPAYLASIGKGALSGLEGLTEIYATALENNLPEVGDFSFEGIPQENITLLVTAGSFDAWANHPIWGLFKVTANDTTGLDEIQPSEGSAIEISCRGGLLTVSSEALITDLRIYTTDGRMAYVASPGSNLVELETASLPSGVVIVVASDADGNSKNLSIML